jgi:hypothetical protein
LFRCQTNGEYDSFQIFHHIIVGEAEHTVAAGREPSIAPMVVTKALLEIVAFAVNLNHELAGMRDKVRNVNAHRGLTTKSEAGKPICL